MTNREGTEHFHPLLSLPRIHHLSLFRSFPSFLALFSDRD